MTSWTLRHMHRYLCVGYIVLFILILVFNFHIFTWQSNYSDDRINRPTYCNQSIIRKHFMQNKSSPYLFAQNTNQFTFSYELSNNNTCSSTVPHALIFVISKSINFASRLAIRRTWGDLSHITSIAKFSHLRLKLLFLIDIDETHMLSIKLEQSIYNDLVQVRLPEQYALSTYRDMAILDWTETYCSQVLLTIKTDDDIFLNIFLLANALTHILRNTTSQHAKIQCQFLEKFNSSPVIYGMKFHNAQVVRSVNDLRSENARYIITNDEYPCTYYPDYMSGFGYIVDRNARLKLLCAFARRTKSFQLSDVYVTGILPEYMNIQRRHLRFKISYQSMKDNCELFFNENNAYACATSLHYAQDTLSISRDVYIFERFNVYWKRVFQNRLAYINRNRF
ncbi:hypothetical protein I4U23_002692 [Adineta vaga]|nr:hypothetical protein I4U23_002692 [Adineta vaga]